jgi:hypothetical protein
MDIALCKLLPIKNQTDYKIHFATWNRVKQPLDVFVNDREEWKGWNSFRGSRDDFNRRFIFSLIRYYHQKDSWPIFERENGGAIMYYMIHVTDPPEAPKFMSRAYRRAVLPLEPIEQLTLDLFNELDDSAEQAPDTETHAVSG